MASKPPLALRGFLAKGLGNDAEPFPAAATVAEHTRKLIAKSSGGALRVDYSASSGRHLLAGACAAAGAVLMQAECYATVLSEAMSADACSRCMTRLPAGGARCRGCGTRFCSDSCLQDAGAEHAAECPALAALESVGGRLNSDLESARLLLRVVARRAVEAAAEDGEPQCGCVAPPLGCK